MLELAEPIKETTEGSPADVDALNADTRALCYTDRAQAQQLNAMAQELAQRLNYRPGLALSLRLAAIIQQIGGDYTQALTQAQESLALYRELADRAGQASALGTLSIIYAELCDYKAALDYYMPAIELVRSLDDPLWLSLNLGNLAGIYVSMEQYPPALDYYKEALAVLDGLSDTPAGQRAFLLNGLALTYLKTEQYTVARDYLLEALNLCEDGADQRRLASVYLGLGEVYRHTGQFQEALEYLSGVRAIFEKLQDKRGLFATLLETGRLHQATGRPAEALSCYQAALALGEEVGFADGVYQTHQALSEFYEGQGNLAEALDHYRRYAEGKAAVNSSANQRALAATQARFKLEKAEQEREIYRLRNVELAGALAQLEDAHQSLAQKNEQIKHYMQSLQRELQVGRQIQADFLPESLPELPGWELLAYFQPAREVAGDFYDVFQLPNGQLVLVIADVCDKGVGAALFMSLIRSLLRVLTGQVETRLSQAGAASENYLVKVPAEQPNQPPWFIPVYTYEVLNTVRLVNEYIAANHARANMFATLFFGVVDPHTGLLSYINAGHDAPILLDRQGVRSRLNRGGPPVGVMPGAKYKLRQVQLEPGATLLAYTDGVTEARDATGEMLSEAALLELVEKESQAGRLGATSLLEVVEEAVQQHVGQAEPSDDVTILGLHRAG